MLTILQAGPSRPSSVVRRRAALVLASVALTCWAVPAQMPPLAIDIIVLDRTGKAPDSLAPSDLAVRVDGQARPVLWIRRVSRGPGALADAAARLAAGRPNTAAYVAEPSRAVVIAIDEGSLPVGAERQVVQVASALLDRLGMNDRVAVVRLPLGSDPITRLTTDRAAIRDTIGQIRGRLASDRSRVYGTTPDSRRIGDHRSKARGDVDEPERPTPTARTPDDSVVAAPDGLDGLVRTLTALSRVPGRKAVAFFSGGLDGDSASRITAAARAAAAARASLYVFDLGVSDDRRNPAVDPAPLARLAQAAGGALVKLGHDPGKDVEPLIRELAACFQISILPTEGDRGGRALHVEARRADLIVRAPSLVGLPTPATEDVEPPLTPPTRPEPPRQTGTYQGAGRVSMAAPAPKVNSARSPELERVLAKLSDYVQGYIGQYSAVVAEESYQQTVGVERRRRRLRSDLLFVKSEPSREWVSFRDVFEVDGTPVRDRDLRLEKLFLAPSPGAWERVKAIRDESARYNIGPFIRNINVPLHPLKIVLPANVGRFVFSLGQPKDIDGVTAWPVAFTETGRPTMVRDVKDYDVPLQGRFLVEQATGAILESTVSAELDGCSVSIVVRYARNRRLGLWVPAGMKERYRNVVPVGFEREAGDIIMEGTARYSNFRRFQVSTEEKLVGPK